MITDNFKIEKKEGITYDPVPDDIYQVELLDIEVKEQEKYKEPTKKEKVFSFQFTILDHEELRGRNIWVNFVPTYLYISSKNGKNKLYQIVESILGRELTPEDEATMDAEKLNKLIGHQLRIFVETITKNDKKFNNVKKFMKLITRLTPLTAEEKEKAKVKNKKEEEKEAIEVASDEIRIEDIPF